MDDKKLIGYKDGMAVYVSDELLAQKGEREVREQLGMIRRYPVKTDLSGKIIMVEGDSHEDAVQRYLSRTIKAPNAELSTPAGGVFGAMFAVDQMLEYGALCRKAALEEAAQEVDHILREGGGTYGDAIRSL